MTDGDRGQIVVLGWDALDTHYMSRFGVGDAFGEHRKRIQTYVNPQIKAPHTYELWPSMITGLHPDEHGVYAATARNGVEWDSDLLRLASRLSDGVLPDSLKTRIGARLQDRGHGERTVSADYYAAHGLDPVVAGEGRTPISIPNYRTDRDRRYGFDGHRDDVWAALDVDRSIPTGLAPQVDRPRVGQTLGGAVGERLGQTLQAARSGDELVWTWFGVLDSVGHMQPALGDGIVRDYYQVAASVTETVRRATTEETVVLSVSDHGIRGGEHTHYATVACDDPDAVSRIDHVFDVADYVRETPLSGGSAAASIDVDGARDVHEELDALGYIS